jgi:hypothetical protein
MREPPTSREFLSHFTDAFDECLPETDEGRSSAWINFTAFVTGSQSKNGGYWKPVERCVLPLVAKKLKLGYQHEYLNLDLVFFHEGQYWGNFVAVEHENAIRSFGEELEKLMSVLAPLKVGITYRENAKEGFDLEALIQEYFGTRHHSIREAPETEYLFLLGVWKKNPKVLAWKYLSFKCPNGAQTNQFQDTGKEYRFEG